MLLGAIVYMLTVSNTGSWALALFVSAVAGFGSGVLTALANRLVGIPTVVASLMVASGLYSINWLLLGKPNQYLHDAWTLPGVGSGFAGVTALLFWIVSLCIGVVVLLHFAGNTLWGLRLRALGENKVNS